MAYRRFTNLQEKFRGDLVTKINEDIKSLDFMDRPCNCSKHCFVNGKCVYKGNCREKYIVYKARCKICDKSYVGGTQDHLKAQMTQHFADIVGLTSTTKKHLPLDPKRQNDIFVSHFKKHFSRNATAQQLHENIEFDILWQGNPLSCVKTFKTHRCHICTMERLFIFKLSKSKVLD